jgi:choline kinase
VKGLILAAGMGTRLLPLTADRPKPLVHVGDVTLLGRLIDQCASIGLDEVIVVTGYKHEFVVAWLEAHPTPVPVQTVYNESYDSLNNAHSVLVARNALEGAGFVKFDGDLVMDTGLLERLVASSWRTAAVVDTGEEVDAEAMKVILKEDGSIAAFGKWLSLDKSSGESIGVEKLAAEDTPPFFDAIEEIVHSQGRSDAYYEDVYHAILGDTWSMGAVQTDGLRWSEVDTVQDLEAARSWVDQVAGAS